ncbi:hypothetical protein LTR70_006674 [Exophiala xenobiotica]|uniref:Uncharacterized protein n=1 Tax=Lithohypha guttulata TaxID=1690604 RepID=A0ABR0K6Y7_9EURO|nr:hypothetical protein LTR24_006247 [Lithohypha guttulata]KAK5315590.1 hypothetical protein LTR70_006674 [Exophiala xenobiotica]
MGEEQVSTPTLLGIPYELRMLIYKLLLGHRTIWISFPPSPDNETSNKTESGITGSLKILRINKQIRNEAQRALEVRTLRIKQLGAMNVQKVLRVTQLISRWASTIETLFLSYELLHQYPRSPLKPAILRSLQEMMASLTNLRAITFEDKYMLGRPGAFDMEEVAKTRAARLGLPMSLFNHITWNLTSKGGIEMRFAKLCVVADTTVSLP